MSCCNGEAVSIELGTGPVLLGRITLNSGEYLIAAALSGIVYAVRREGTEVGSDTLDPGWTVHDTLQTDARWTVDQAGYNFEFDAPHTLFASEGVYEVTVTFVPLTGNPVKVRWEVVVSG